MQTLKVIPYINKNQTYTQEEIDCFLLHLKSLGLSFTPFIDEWYSLIPREILKILKEEKNSVIVLAPSLRIITDPLRFFSLVCDMACFTNSQNKVGSRYFIEEDFLLFHPSENTFYLIEEWIRKIESSEGQNLFSLLSVAIKNKAPVTKILPLSSLLKKEAVNDSPFFHRWFLKI
ncbi:MAG: hypothetical protein FJZ62_04300 [Chlamydiae bacterium]|nr:hypothetical protein [Chlamydiota bacterium]